MTLVDSITSQSRGFSSANSGGDHGKLEVDEDKRDDTECSICGPDSESEDTAASDDRRLVTLKFCRTWSRAQASRQQRLKACDSDNLRERDWEGQKAEAAGKGNGASS